MNQQKIQREADLSTSWAMIKKISFSLDLLLKKMRVINADIVCVIISIDYAAAFYSYIREVNVEDYEKDWTKETSLWNFLVSNVFSVTCFGLYIYNLFSPF